MIFLAAKKVERASLGRCSFSERSRPFIHARPEVEVGR
jgi:hypothetical protein